MPRLFSALLSGLVFGFGLIVSGMVNPAKVLGFLDIAGNWDPSLAFVMIGAIGVTAPGYFYLRKKSRPVLGSQFHWPTTEDIDGRLLTGAAIFGLGWGLGGLCPGPALAGLTLGNPGVLIFVCAMIAGMVAVRMLSPR